MPLDSNPYRLPLSTSPLLVKAVDTTIRTITGSSLTRLSRNQSVVETSCAPHKLVHRTLPYLLSDYRLCALSPQGGLLWIPWGKAPCPKPPLGHINISIAISIAIMVATFSFRGQRSLGNSLSQETIGCAKWHLADSVLRSHLLSGLCTCILY